jgi:hypothetical protein
MLKNLLLLPAAAIAMVGLTACDDDDDDPAATNTPAITQTAPAGETPGLDDITVDLEGVGDNGVDGMAVINGTEDASSAMVSVTLDDASASGVAALYAGSCDQWEEPAVATIGDVSAGMASGTVTVSLEDIESDDHVVVVMPAAGGDPISCGSV